MTAEEFRTEVGVVSAEHRNFLKRKVDAEVRHRTAHGHQRTTCKGCGCDIDTYVIGCRICGTRKYERTRRAERRAA